METAAFLGMLGLGYAMQPKRNEGFIAPIGDVHKPYEYESIVPGVAVKQPPLKYEAPVGVRSSAAKELDVLYNFPAGQRIPSEPNPGMQAGYLGFPVPAIDTSQIKNKAVTPMVRMSTDRVEKTPVLMKETKFVSALSGVAMKPEDFTHANMVPFFRGTPKQNMNDTANSNILDTYTGGGVYQQEKREQGAMFDQQREPTGVPFGSEIATDYMQERVVAPTNRAGEMPFEQVRVGKGLGEGFTSLPSGGYQQASSLTYARPKTTDELRVATNPKVSFKGVTIAGANFVARPGKIGEVRKHTPDTFYINENGERNFTTTGANLKSTERPVQVIRNTTRPETTTEYAGGAKSADFNATYTVPSTRAPMVKQHGSWGYRNANATSYIDKNTDAEQNDYGKGSIEIRPNERYFTGNRTQTLNPVPSGAGKTTLPLQDGPRQTRKDEMLGNPNQAGYFSSGVQKSVAYDPNDIARTTIKETTIDNDYLGNANGPKRLTVYDPNDVVRKTIRETTEDSDYIGVAAGPNKSTVYDPNDPARKTIRETTEDSDYLGVAAGPNKSTVYDPNDPMRKTIRETTENSDYVGTAAGPIRLTVYDPTDLARTTIKETTVDNDYVGTVTGPQKLTVYDPDDVARTTIKETTGDTDYLGTMTAVGAQKLTVYDPDDITRITQRNTTDNFDYTRNVFTAGTPAAEYLPYSDIARVTDREELSAKSEYYGNSDPNYPQTMMNPFLDGARNTQKAAISAKSAYTGGGNSEDKKPLVNPFLDGARLTQKAAISARSAYAGSAGPALAKAPREETAERAMRHYAQKENVAKGRSPAGNIAIFNGEDYMNVQHQKIESDYINDREPVLDRVVAVSASEANIGLMRPRTVLKLDVSRERMEPGVVEGLESNPYVIPLHPTNKKK